MVTVACVGQRNPTRAPRAARFADRSRRAARMSASWRATGTPGEG